VGGSARGRQSLVLLLWIERRGNGGWWVGVVNRNDKSSWGGEVLQNGPQNDLS
jgi:hypothetical protein